MVLNDSKLHQTWRITMPNYFPLSDKLEPLGRIRQEGNLLFQEILCCYSKSFRWRTSFTQSKNNCFVTKFWRSTEERWVAPGAKLKHPHPQWHEHVSFLTKCSHSSAAVLSVEVASEFPTNQFTSSGDIHFSLSAIFICIKPIPVV